MQPLAALAVPGNQEILIRLEVAATAEAKARGLSEREPFMPDMGMVFPFAVDVWMPFTAQAMKFPLDVLFLDAENRVVSTALNVQPGTPQIKAGAPYRTVLELLGGTVAAREIDLTRPVRFLLPVSPRPIDAPGLLGQLALFGLGAAAKGAIIGATLKYADASDQPYRSGFMAGGVLQAVGTALRWGTRPDMQFEAAQPKAAGAVEPPIQTTVTVLEPEVQRAQLASQMGLIRER